MNRYETSINNKRMFIIYSVGGVKQVYLSIWLRNGCIESPQEVAQVFLANTINYNELKLIEKSPILSMNFSF